MASRTAYAITAFISDYVTRHVLYNCITLMSAGVFVMNKY